MDNKFVSLLYPNEKSRLYHLNRDNLPKISDEVLSELGFDDFLKLSSANLSEFFTMDEAVIKYRQEAIEDLCHCPELLSTLSEIHPILDDIRELRRLDNEGLTSADSYLYSITEIELYVSCIETLRRGFDDTENKIKSEACRALCSYITELTSSEYYKELNKKLETLSERVSEVKSITVGVNLDREMRPESAAVISLNSEKFKSGKVLDKILRLSFKNDAFTTIAELTPFGKGQSENRQDALVGAFNSALEDVFRSSVRGWRSIVAEYVLENTDFLISLLPEIEFASRAAEFLAKLARKGAKTSYPVFHEASEKAFLARELYNPRIALATDASVVTNDVAFDDKARIYVLTGPNRGGKSVITVAMGAAQALFQLGLPVPAEYCELSVVDAIYTHFPEGAEDTINKGRLGEECDRLRQIFDAASGDSMILLDESLSSTGAYEASYIAAEILSAFAVRRCRGIFSTHLHELAAQVDEINARSASHGGVLIDTLVAGIEYGERSFKIHRMKPDGKSYARDIANKYGLSFDSLMEGKA